MAGDDYERSKSTLANISRFLVKYGPKHDELVNENSDLIAENQKLKRLLKEAEEKNKQVEAAGATITILEEERRTLASSLCEANTEKLELAQVNKEIEAKNKELIESIDQINKTFDEQFKDFRTVSTPAIIEDNALVNLPESESQTTSKSLNVTKSATVDTAAISTMPSIEQNSLANPPESESQNTSKSLNFTKSATVDTAAISTKIPTRPKKKTPKKRRPSLSDSDNDADVPFDSNYKLKSSQQICKLCKSKNGSTKIFKHFTALSDHLTQTHPNSVAPFYFRCRYFGTGCSKHFTTERGLLNHITLVHPNGKVVIKSLKKPKTSQSKPLTCSICNGESFSYRLFQKHMNKFHAGTPEATELIKNSTNLKIPVPSTNHREISSRKILSTEQEEPSSRETSSEPNNMTNDIDASRPSAHPDPCSVDIPTLVTSDSLFNINEQILLKIKKETMLEDPMHCSCGFSSSDGNAIATHLLDCEQKNVYSNPETAAQQYALRQNKVQDSDEASKHQFNTNNRGIKNVSDVFLLKLPNNNNQNISNNVTRLNTNHFVSIQQNIENVDNVEIEYEVFEISDDD